MFFENLGSLCGAKLGYFYAEFYADYEYLDLRYKIGREESQIGKFGKLF